MHKKYLIINTVSPIDDWYAEESLEVMLSLSSLEYEVSCLFLQHAAFQLLSEQKYQAINREPFAKAMQALALFDIKNIYIEDIMLEKILSNNLKTFINAKSFSVSNLTDIYNSHDIILCY